MQKKQKYIFKVGEKGKERLEVMNEICNPYSLSFLQKNEIKKGMRILDIGCGIGLMSIELAKMIGRNGSLIAIDSSIEQLKITEELAEKAGIKNIHFLHLNANNLDALEDKFDIIYSRFLFCHLLNPFASLAKAINLLKKNGRIICEEPVGFNSCISYPDSLGYKTWIKVCELHFNLQTSDPIIGLKLNSFFQQQNLYIKKMGLVQPILENPRQKSIIRLGINEVNTNLVEKKLISLEVLKQAEQDLITVEKDCCFFTPFISYLQIAVQKI